jgi:hypothetical protein
MVYGSSPATGYAQIALARVCKHFDKTCVLFMAKRKIENAPKGALYGVHSVALFNPFFS